MKFLYPISKWDYNLQRFHYYRIVDNKLRYTDARSCGRFIGYDYDNKIVKNNDIFRIIIKEFERDVNEIRKSSNHKN